MISLKIFFFACFGVYALAGALQGALERPMGLIWRMILAVVGCMLLWPDDIYRYIGLACFVALFVAHLKFLKPAPVA